MADRIENKKISSYRLYLREPYRTPSRGGNTSALHAHVLKIDGETYSFLAPGSQQWVFASDLVSFEYEFKGPYRNVIKETLKTVDNKGRSVVRGNRGFKSQLRTAESRLPGSRRERKD